MYQDILDDDFHIMHDFQLKEAEKLVWKGNPQRNFAISLTNVIFRNTDVYFLAIVEAVLLIYTLIFLYFLFNGILLERMIGWIIGPWLVILIAEGLTYYRKLQTEYFLTNQRVVIKTIWHFKNKLYEVPLKDIGDVKCSSYKDGYGMIYLITNKKMSFRTRDFYVSGKRIYPTLELVKDCKEIAKIIIQRVNKEQQSSVS